jgi:hypothetical protein
LPGVSSIYNSELVKLFLDSFLLGPELANSELEIELSAGIWMPCQKVDYFKGWTLFRLERLGVGQLGTGYWPD